MTKHQRTLLFLVLLGLFLILAPSFAFYSQGYRIDIQGKKITQTGAFYFKIAPTRADIFVDGIFTKRTDFLFGTAFTKNFFPGAHLIEITKTGYHSWKKILDIKEQQVTETKNVLLFKENPEYQALAQNVQRFWISPNKQYALLNQHKSDTPWQLNLLNLQTKGIEPFITGVSLEDEIIEIIWAKDSQHFLLRSMHKEQLITEIRNISTGQPCFKISCNLDYLGQNLGDIKFSPATSNEVLFTKFLNTTQALFQAQYEMRKPAIPIATNVIAFISHGKHVFWLSNDGTLWQKDVTSNDKGRIFQNSTFLPKKETAYKLFIIDNTILVKEDSTLFLHTENTLKRRELLSPVFKVVVNPGNTKVALHNQSELWILFLNEETEQPQHQAGELILLTRFSKPIDQLAWINSSYLLFGLGGTIRSIEIDTRDQLNTIDFDLFLNQDFFWNNEKGILYVLNEDTFFASEKMVR